MCRLFLHVLFFCAALGLGFPAISAPVSPAASTSPVSEVSIQWLGQACFALDVTQSNGKPFRIVFDPYGPQVGYPIHPLKADVVFVSHEHFDHNNVAMVPGARIIRGLKNGGKAWADMDEELAPGIWLHTIGTYHDGVKGAKRGLNSVAVLDIDGIRIAHLGDLGHLLTPVLSKAVGQVDVLLVPVGGVYTIDGKEAQKEVAYLDPKIVIPMHYKTKYTTNLPIHPVDQFLEGKKWPVHKLDTDILAISRNRLPERTEVYVLTPLSSQR